MKIAVCMFGMNRSLDVTADSIENLIIRPLRETFGHVKILAHFNVSDFIENVRSGEQRLPFTNAGIDAILTDLTVEEDQTNPAAVEFSSACMQYPLLGEEDISGNTRRNIGLQLYSLNRLSEMLDDYHEEFDIFVIIRPDLRYMDSILTADIERFVSSGANLMIPSWQSHGGLNDRFCIADRLGMKTYLSRSIYIHAFAKKFGYIHSESLLKYAVEKDRLQVRFMDVRGARIRSGGKEKSETFGLSYKDRIAMFRFSLRNFWLSRASELTRTG